MPSKMFSGFDWDDGNLQKAWGDHRRDRERVRRHPGDRTGWAHSKAEARFLAIGTARSGRYVFLAFTWHERDGANLIRPISARYVHAKEVQQYKRR